MDAKRYAFDTLAVHAGAQAETSTGARAVPIYQTTAYCFHDTQHAARLFALEEAGHIYTRLSNPTHSVAEERLAALEGGIGAVATSSGQAAITLALLALAKAGDHIVSSASIYGGTHNLLAHTFARFGIDVTMADTADPESFRRAIRPNTKAIYGETVGNPRVDLFPFEEVAEIAHGHGLPLIMDNTIPTAALVRPLEWGADVVVYSTSKYINGHGNSLGGMVIDGGRFDWAHSARHPEFAAPDPNYHGLVFAQAFGAAAYIARVRAVFLRDLGPAQAPLNSFLNIIGMETLSLRMAKHVDNASRVADFLVRHPQVAWVTHPSLPDYPRRAQALRIAPRGLSAVLGFGIRGGRSAGAKFIDHLKLFSHLANIGDAKSLAIHPASTTHQQMSAAERLAGGITDDFIRLSVGLEHPDDLLWDLDQALAAAAM